MRPGSRLVTSFYRTISSIERRQTTTTTTTTTTKRVLYDEVKLLNRKKFTMSASSSTAPGGVEKPVEVSKVEVEELPPLSDRDFKIYNRLADKMDYFVSLIS